MTRMPLFYFVKIDIKFYKIKGAFRSVWRHRQNEPFPRTTNLLHNANEYILSSLKLFGWEHRLYRATQHYNEKAQKCYTLTERKKICALQSSRCLMLYLSSFLDEAWTKMKSRQMKTLLDWLLYCEQRGGKKGEVGRQSGEKPTSPYNSFLIRGMEVG